MENTGPGSEHFSALKRVVDGLDSRRSPVNSGANTPVQEASSPSQATPPPPAGEPEQTSISAPASTVPAVTTQAADAPAKRSRSKAATPLWQAGFGKTYYGLRDFVTAQEQAGNLTGDQVTQILGTGIVDPINASPDDIIVAICDIKEAILAANPILRKRVDDIVGHISNKRIIKAINLTLTPQTRYEAVTQFVQERCPAEHRDAILAAGQLSSLPLDDAQRASEQMAGALRMMDETERLCPELAGDIRIAGGHTFAETKPVKTGPPKLSEQELAALSEYQLAQAYRRLRQLLTGQRPGLTESQLQAVSGTAASHLANETAFVGGKPKALQLSDAIIHLFNGLARMHADFPDIARTIIKECRALPEPSAARAAPPPVPASEESKRHEGLRQLIRDKQKAGALTEAQAEQILTEGNIATENGAVPTPSDLILATTRMARKATEVCPELRLEFCRFMRATPARTTAA